MTRSVVSTTRPPRVLSTKGTVGVLLVAACMRPAITSVGPVLSEIGASEHLTHTLLGLLITLPLLAFATISPVVHGPARRFGVERVILAALTLLTVGILVRSLTGTVGLWAGTVVVGVGVAVLNVLLPVVVKARYHANVALMTGLYSAALGAMAAIASGVALPLAELPGGWRWSLGVWALLTAGAAVVWARSSAEGVAAVVDSPVEGIEGVRSGAKRHRSVWRSATAWRITAFMGLQSTSFYVLVAWLPAIAVARQVGPTLAGWYLFTSQIVGVLAGMVLPQVLNRFGRRVSGVVVSVPMVAACLGLLALPSLAPLWAVLIGLSTGPALVLSLSMIGIAGRDAAHGAQLSGMVQSVAYALAAIGPVVAGWLRDSTGSWNATLVMITCIAVTQAAVTSLRRWVPDSPRAA